MPGVNGTRRVFRPTRQPAPEDGEPCGSALAGQGELCVEAEGRASKGGREDEGGLVARLGLLEFPS